MLVQHHEKYEEIHGEDKIVMMTQSDHKRLHNRLRREGKCNIPSAELLKISSAAHKRTERGKAYRATYHRTRKGRLAKRQYYIQNIQQLYFGETVAPHIRLEEVLRYNNNTGCFTYCTLFRGGHGYKIPVVEIG